MQRRFGTPLVVAFLVVACAPLAPAASLGGKLTRKGGVASRPAPQAQAEPAPAPVGPAAGPGYEVPDFLPDEIKANLYQGRPGEAVRLALAMIDNKPNEPRNFVILAHCYRANKQTDEGLRAAARALELLPTDWESFLVKGQLQLDARDCYEAEISLKRSVELNSQQVVGLAYLARAQVFGIKLKEAVGNLQEALRRNPNQPDLWALLAGCFYYLGDYDQSFDAAEKAFGGTQVSMLGISSLTGDMKMGGFNVYINKFVGSVVPNSPAQLAGILPGDRVIAMNGKRLPGLQGCDEALALLERGPVGETVTLTIGRPGARKDQEFTLRRVQATRVGQEEAAASALGYRARVLREKDQLVKASKEASSALKTCPGSESVRVSQALVDADWEKYDVALSRIEGIPDDERSGKMPHFIAQLLLLRAIALAHLGDVKGATAAFSRAKALGVIRPDFKPLWADKERFAAAIGADKLRAEAMRAAKAGGPEAIDKLRLGMTVSCGDYEERPLLDEIFAWARRVRARPSEEAIRRSERAQLLFGDKKFSRAVTEIMEALDQAPFEASLYCNAALILAEVRRYSEAIRAMRIYLDAAPDASDYAENKSIITQWELQLEDGKGR